MDIENYPSKEVVWLFKRSEKRAHLFDTFCAPLSIKNKEVIPWSVLNIIFIKLSSKLSLFLFIKISVDIWSQKSMKIFFFKTFLLPYLFKLLFTCRFFVVKICVNFKIKGEFNNFGKSLQVFDIVAECCNLLNKFVVLIFSDKNWS